MIDELPGYASEIAAHEDAVAAAQADGWQIKGYAAASSGTDVMLLVLLWRDGAQPGTAADPMTWGPAYGPLRAVQKAVHAEKLAALSAPKIALAKPKTARKK